MIGWSYRHLVKPILFKFDPETVHQRMVRTGHRLGQHAATRALVCSLLSYQHPALEQTIAGIHFRNPVGLSAGFDKNAELIPIMAAVGFGFVEVGSITAEPYAGNPKPRLWRVPKSQSILVHIGLANSGSEAIASQLEHTTFPVPVGISIAKIGDWTEYNITARRFRDIGQYQTLNVSCPNVTGATGCQHPDRLDRLLSAYRAAGMTKPVFVKISPDLDFGLVDELLAVLLRHHVTGIICGNLTKDHTYPAGGLSGPPTREKSLAMIRHVYQKTGKQLVIIGAGGVFSAEDAYAKIKAGASLVQLITGMIYRGPQLIGEINRGLVQLLRQDGYRHISEAIGTVL